LTERSELGRCAILVHEFRQKFPISVAALQEIFCRTRISGLNNYDKHNTIDVKKTFFYVFMFFIKVLKKRFLNVFLIFFLSFSAF